MQVYSTCNHNFIVVYTAIKHGENYSVFLITL